MCARGRVGGRCSRGWLRRQGRLHLIGRRFCFTNRRFRRRRRELHRQLAEHLQNPYKLDEAQGSLADDMRIKLLYDLAYTASLEKLSTFLRTELGVIVRTPLVMLRMAQGR